MPLAVTLQHRMFVPGDESDLKFKTVSYKSYRVPSKLADIPSRPAATPAGQINVKSCWSRRLLTQPDTRMRCPRRDSNFTILDCTVWKHLAGFGNDESSVSTIFLLWSLHIRVSPPVSLSSACAFSSFFSNPWESFLVFLVAD